MRFIDKQIHRLGIVGVLFAVALLGIGCNTGDSPAVQSSQPRADAGAKQPTVDAGDRVPEGWQVYRSEEWNVAIAYPNSWYYGELESDPLFVAFGSQPIESFPESDATYPVMLSVRRQPVAEVVGLFGNEAEQASVVVSRIPATRIIYFSDLLGQNQVVYIFGQGDSTYLLESVEDSEFRDEFDIMLQTISLGGE